MAAHRLIEYYLSAAFADDHSALIALDPAEAEQQRRLLNEQLNENLTALGIEPCRTELETQALFVSGEMPMWQMLEHVQFYGMSIMLRWPE